jgi:PTH1 family peptidyl-tRNA hydrolase
MLLQLRVRRRLLVRLVLLLRRVRLLRPAMPRRQTASLLLAARLLLLRLWLRRRRKAARSKHCWHVRPPPVFAGAARTCFALPCFVVLGPAMAGTPLKIIVGLGNPGPEHLLTRHNAGFWFVDALAAKAGARFRSHTKFQGEICRTQLSGGEVTLLKPMTYMNRSGLSIRALVDYLKVSPAEVLVAHDELDLPVGDVRFKFGGGAGGHNGLRDTITHLGADFWRLRLGIGHPGDKSEVIDYVLRRAPKDEEESLLEAVGDALSTLPIFLEQGAERAMNGLHGKG